MMAQNKRKDLIKRGGKGGGRLKINRGETCGSIADTLLRQNSSPRISNKQNRDILKNALKQVLGEGRSGRTSGKLVRQRRKKAQRTNRPITLCEKECL